MLLGIILGYDFIAGRIWKGDVLIADLEQLEKMDTSEIYPRIINAKEVLISQNGEELKFPVADDTVKLSERDYECREPTPRREQTVRSEDLSGELQGEPGEPQPTESKVDAEVRAELWSIQCEFIYRHHNEPRVQLHVPKEEINSVERNTSEKSSNDSRPDHVGPESMDQNLESRSESRKTRMEKRSPNSTMLEN